MGKMVWRIENVGSNPDAVDSSVLVLERNPVAWKIFAGYAGKGERMKESSPASKEAKST